ncbi:MAG: hypothetical protein ACPH9R_05080, partial [Litorivicinaceae bacterium]
MHRFLSLGVLLALIGCSSAPDKPSPTPLKRITEIVEIDDVESTSLGGGDQTGLSPAVDGDSIAAASAGGDVYVLKGWIYNTSTGLDEYVNLYLQDVLG